MVVNSAYESILTMEIVMSDSNNVLIVCCGDVATNIGRKFIKDKKVPVVFTESEYEVNKREIEYYEKKGIISVIRPEDDNYAKAMSRLNIITEQKDINTRRTTPLPPKSRLIPQGNLPQPNIEWTGCVAVKKNGDVCNYRLVDGTKVCSIHKNAIDKGKVVKDYNDRIIKDYTV
jgi:hypothetical protein